jgi:putative ABC transport system ATP-binding protein
LKTAALDAQANTSAVIRLQGLQRRYVMGAEFIDALRAVDLTVEANEYLAIMGQSGSGKSTLMNIIGCLDRPTAGEYWLNQQRVSEMNDRELARARNQAIGFVFQTFNLLPRIALETVGLADRMMHRPSELSGGQRQRVAVARALVTNPSILLADEPTGNLDSSTGNEIMKLFDSLHEQGNTLIVVTHEQHIADHAERIVRLSDGDILSDQKS